jgi:hypothetical protein
MRLLAKIFATLVCFFSLPQSWGQQLPDNQQSHASELVVRLVLERRDFQVGQSIPVTIEVSNCGDNPLLVGNFILRGSGGTPVSRIEFELKDAEGRIIPSNYEVINDSFGAKKGPNAAAAFLSSYVLLYPEYSLKTQVRISPRQYQMLKNPGTYILSATYSSNGTSYPPAYRQAGLTDDDVKSVPFRAWNGKLSTNDVRFQIRASRPTTKK